MNTLSRVENNGLVFSDIAYPGLLRGMHSFAVWAIAMLVLISMIGIVYVKYQNQNSFIYLDRLQKQGEVLEEKIENLSMEKANLLQQSHLHTVAVDNLHMVMPHSAQVKYIQYE